MAPRVEAGKTPEQWATEFAARGIKISARRIRERAKAIGACLLFGSTMILLPEHIDRLFEPPAPDPRDDAARRAFEMDLANARATSAAAEAHLLRLSKRRPAAAKPPRRRPRELVPRPKKAE